MKRHNLTLACLIALCIQSVVAQTSDGAATSLKLDYDTPKSAMSNDSSSQPAASTSKNTSAWPSEGGFFKRARNVLEKIWDEGREDIYITGYAYHDPGTYTAEKRATLNNNAWGGGYGRTITSDRGNTHALYAMAFLDSHKNVQPNIGYAYQAVWGSSIKVGAGATFLIASRPDIFHGVPFPAIMPLFSIGTERASLMFVPLPKLSNSQNANNGNVLFVFGKFAYK